ncbi:MAG: DUF1540 domain-containing protein [Clostridia bacterium]|nr:DUF1540 domain-containing protein [Clostridia bacterium]
MNKNFGVCCDVSTCVHNQDGCNCDLDKIRVTCGCGDGCTCCGSFVKRTDI